MIEVAELDNQTKPGSTLTASGSAFKVRLTPKRVNLFELSAIKALYTVSVGLNAKPMDEVLDGFEWALENLPGTSVLLGDGLFRITLEILKGIGSTAAEEQARRTGDETLAFFKSRFGDNYEIIRSSDVMGSKDFSLALDIVHRLFGENAKFSASVWRDAASFVDRQVRKRRLGIEVSKAVRLARNYVEQEVAVYLVLAQQDRIIDIYLGHELPTLRRIIEGEIVPAPSHLQRRISVSLESRRKKGDCR